MVKVKGALRLQAVDAAAAAQGLRGGMTLADARALVPDLDVQAADPAADQALLHRLLQALRRYTPSLAPAPPDGIDLDVTGAAGLHGGEGRLVKDMLVRTRRFGLEPRLGLADTASLARALARYGRARAVVAPAGERAEVLAPLPVAALELEPHDTATLSRLGLKRVGQLLDLPRPALARRFGEGLLDRLDERLGLRASPLDLDLEQPLDLAERRLAEPVASEDVIVRYFNDLAMDVEESLERKGQGGRRFVFELFRVDGAVKRLEVAASRPLRDAARIVALLGERLAGLNEGLEADFGFDHLRLWASNTEPMAPERLDLLQRRADEGSFAALLDRIAARDGLEVRRLVPRDLHQPKNASVSFSPAPLAPAPFSPAPGRRDRGAGAGGEAWAAEQPPRFDDAPLRPLRLFSPPQPVEEVIAEVPEGPPAKFLWRRVWRLVSRAEGPERLEPEGAQADPLSGHPARTRDYYRVEDEQGRRYWVFREGLYGQGSPPRWFLHGLFG